MLSRPPTAAMPAPPEEYVFYGALSVRVLAENTAASGASGPVTRGRVDPSRGHAVLDVVDAQLFLGGREAPQSIAVRCTLRRKVVVCVGLEDITEIRRVSGGTSVEIDFSIPEHSELVGAIRRRHTMTVLSARGDTAVTAELYGCVLRMQRAVTARGGTMPSYGSSRALTAASGRSFAPGGFYGGGGGGAMTSNALYQDSTHLAASSYHDQGAPLTHSSALQPQAQPSDVERELLRIQERRRMRQQTLVRDILAVNGSPSTHHTGGADDGVIGVPLTSGRNDVATQLFAPRTAAAMNSGAMEGQGATWCRWCAEFRHDATHSATCSNRPIQCSWCGSRMTHAMFQSHQFTCVAMPDHLLAAGQSKASAEHARRMREAMWTMLQQQQLQGAGPSNEQPRRASSRSPVPSGGVSPTPSVPAAPDADAASAAAESGGRRCVWCKKHYPKSHDEKCPQRRKVCKACFEQVLLADVDAHRLTCKKVPSRSSAAVVAGGGARAASSSSALEDANGGGGGHSKPPTPTASERSVRFA